VGDTRVLRGYERARKADLQMVGGAGDALQRLFTHTHPALQSLRNLGMNTFNGNGLLKQWVIRRAMGASATPDKQLSDRTPP